MCKQSGLGRFEMTKERECVYECSGLVGSDEVVSSLCGERCVYYIHKGVCSYFP